MLVKPNITKEKIREKSLTGNNGGLYAHSSQPSGGNLQSDDWTMFHHDVRNTGCTSEKGPSYLVEKWSYEVGSNARVTGSPAVYNDRVYIAARAFTPGTDVTEVSLYCFDHENGGNGPIWTADLGVWEFISSPAVEDCDEDGTAEVYIKCARGNSGKLFSYDINGNYEWEVSLGKSTGIVQSSPTIYMTEAPDSVIFVGMAKTVPYTGDAMFAINGFGDIMWSRPIATTHSTVAIADGNNDGVQEVYLGGAGSAVGSGVYCLDRDTGDTEWAHPINKGSPWFSSPVVADGDNDGQLEVYIVQRERFMGKAVFYCLDASDGQLEWKRELFGVDRYSSPAVADYNDDGDLEIYVATETIHYSVVYRLDPTNDGQTIWTFYSKTGQWCHDSPAVSSNGNVYIGFYGGYIYCLDASNGQEKSHYKVGGSPRSSPAIYDGKLYIGSWDGSVNCLGQSELNVEIQSGFHSGNLPVVISNEGNADCKDIDWTITSTPYFGLASVSGSGTISSLPAQTGSKTVTGSPSGSFGIIQITAKAEVGVVFSDTASAVVIGSSIYSWG